MKIESVDPDSHLAADGWRTYFVSKLRARLTAGEMEDLTFQPYDAVAGLRSLDTERRIEAATYLGSTKRPSGARALVWFLRGRQRSPLEYVPRLPGISSTGSSPTGQDIRSALWALGEVGSPEAVACLLRWADGPSTETTLEAFDSLARLKTPELLPLAVETMNRTGKSDIYDVVSRTLGQLSYEAIVAFGDSTCLPRLRQLSRIHPASPTLEPTENENWLPHNDDSGNRLLIARAACGEVEARRLLVKAIVDGSSITNTDAMLAEARRGGSINGFPSSLLVGATLIASREGHAGFWPPLSAVLDGLGGRLALRDSLLRLVAADAAVPQLGQTLVLGLLAAPTETDKQLLDGHWSNALREPKRAQVPVDMAWQQGKVFEDYNLTACAVVYAFTRWRDASALRRLWASCPMDDPTLRSEIALGLATCGEPEDLVRLEEYIRKDWTRRVETPAFQERLESLASNPAINELGLAIDADYRSRPIHQFVCGAAGGTKMLRSLIRDPQLSPAIRLDWINFAVGNFKTAPGGPAESPDGARRHPGALHGRQLPGPGGRIDP